MVDTFGMTGIMVLAFLVLVAVYIILRLIGWPGNDEDESEDGPEKEEEKEEAVQYSENAGKMSDDEFIDTYTGPILEDAFESLEMAIGHIKSGLHFYGEGKWETAGEDLNSAARKLDEASGKFREIPGIVEDQRLEPVVRAKARMDECKLLRALTIRMEEACDAMVEGKPEEAKKLDIVKTELDKLAGDWKK
jgi:hypothetical protein